MVETKVGGKEEEKGKKRDLMIAFIRWWQQPRCSGFLVVVFLLLHTLRRTLELA